MTLFKTGRYAPSLTGKDLPESIWNCGILHIPTRLSEAHRDHLVTNGWMEGYLNGAKSKAIIGGESKAEAEQHFVERFLNSVARAQFVCADPSDSHPEIRDMVLDQLADGRLFLLDLAAGNGAGTLAILSLLCELRALKCIPKLPINVSIVAVDYSCSALELYQEMLNSITSWLEENGINISLTRSVCDLRIAGAFNEVLESVFNDAKAQGVNRFLCVLSAVSGIGKEGLEEIHDSLKLAAAKLSDKKRNSSWLWIEPHKGKSWFAKFANTIGLILQKIPFRFTKKGESYEIKANVPLTHNPPTLSFQWFDPHKQKIVESWVMVMAFKDD